MSDVVGISGIHEPMPQYIAPGYKEPEIYKLCHQVLHKLEFNDLLNTQQTDISWQLCRRQ
jgi:hypothetical protein